MSLNYQDLYQQVRQFGEGELARQADLQQQRQLAQAALASWANDGQRLRQKALQALEYDSNLRCAIPVGGTSEPLDAALPLPPPPAHGTLIAADGSQINPDRHAQVNYSLVNTGSVQLQLGSDAPPAIRIGSRLITADEFESGEGGMTVNQIALLRDVSERAVLADLAETAPDLPVITMTDGTIELWGSKDPAEASQYREMLQEYLQALQRLADLGAVTAGYVDKPAANLVVRLLEVAITPEAELPEIAKKRPLRGAADRFLFRSLLAPGERSAVFALQSGSTRMYPQNLEVHFFYLNVGRAGSPWLARVEIPAWVASRPDMVDTLHAVLVSQCRALGTRPYPYLLHRAHETALVSRDEKEQLTTMIVQELLRRGLPLDQVSQKQAVKDLQKRTRYSS